MTGHPGATAFVTEATGFLGMELISVLKAGGHQVFGLTPSREAARRLRDAGAEPVMGDLLEPGRWQDEVSADWVFHLSPPWCGPRMTRRRAASMARTRLLADTQLLDAVAAGATRRIVYVADIRCYGATGRRPVTEDEPPKPDAWGRYLTPALDRLDGYTITGLPIVTAFPGWVYGNDSWFRARVVDPVMSGRRALQFGRLAPWISPIHVHDCARALMHLAEFGETGSRYFLVNSDPILLHEFAETVARLANRPLRVWRMPAVAARLLLGPVLADHVRSDGVFSNIRLRGTGFRFKYPTLEQGVQQVLGALHDSRTAAIDRRIGARDDIGKEQP